MGTIPNEFGKTESFVFLHSLINVAPYILYAHSKILHGVSVIFIAWFDQM